MVLKLLTVDDLTNGIYDAVFKQMAPRFAIDELRSQTNQRFKDGDGWRNVSGIQDLIKNPHRKHSDAYFLCSFNAKDIKDITDPYEQFQAGTLYWIFPQAKINAPTFGFIEYLFSAKPLDGKGYAIKLAIEATENMLNKDTRFIFAEVETECGTSAKEEREARKERLALFEALGGRPLIAKYTQPNYTKQLRVIDMHPVLVKLKDDGINGIPRDHLLNFVKAFYRDVYGLRANNEYYKTMEESLKNSLIVEPRDARYTSGSEGRRIILSNLIARKLSTSKPLEYGR